MRRRSVPGVVHLVLLGALLTGGVQAARADAAALLGRRIVSIDFVCAAPLDRDELARLMPMHVGDTLTADLLDAAHARLAQTQIFSDVAIEPQERGPEVAIIVRLTRKPVINAVRFRGNHALGDDELLRTSRLHEGTALTDEGREFALTRIHDRYVAEGFENAQVTLRAPVRIPGEVDVTFLITEGEPLRIAAVEIEGAVTVPATEVRAALPVKVGDRYMVAQRRKAQAAIVRLFRDKQYYEVQVNSTWERGDGARGTLRFQIDPGPLFEVQFSGNRHLSDQRLLALMDLPQRPIVTDGTWRELARRARRAYQEAGYYLARVDLDIVPGPPKQVRFKVTEDGVFHVADVTFDGNAGLSARLLREQMATQPPSWIPWHRGIFLDEVVDDDLKRLWYFYRRYGYEAAEIVDIHTRLDREYGKIFVTVFIEEGPQTIVRHLERAGMEAIGAKLPDLQVRVGAPLNRDAVEADRHVLITAFARQGYTRAAVEAQVTTQPGDPGIAATVRFAAVAGERERVGAIIVQNNIETRARVIRRELPFKEGDWLDPDALLRGQGNIYRLGLFRSATVRPLDTVTAGERRDVAVSVAEKPAGTAQWGAGYNTRDGLRGFVELGYANLQGLARRVSLRGEVSFDPTASRPTEYVGNLGFREPRLGDTQWTFRVNVVAQRTTRSVDQFSLERLALIPAIERMLLPGLQTGLELQAEQSQVFDVASDVLLFNPRDEGRLRTVSFGPFAVYDGRDDAFVPRRGVFDSLRLRSAPSQLGSDVPFVKLTGQHSQYIPLSENVTFVYAVRGGWAWSFAKGQEVPIRERFFLGGRTTVRGFAENSIGPEGAMFVNAQGVRSGGQDPLGGDMVLNLNDELRFPLAYGVGGAVFADGGGVYLQDRTLSIDNFRRSAGLGLRYITPVGPMSLDYGFKLDRRTGESVGEVHFSIGNIF
jgi:outer membrane protein insertion porin family